MTKVFLTGGNGYVATHILENLLAQGYSVVTSVRSHEKAQKIFALYPDLPKSKLDVITVEDISKANAFDKAIISEPPFDIAIHTACPYRYDVADIKTELFDPAVTGTVGILGSIKNYAPSIKRVIITGSIVSILDIAKGNRPGHTYTEADWNPTTEEETLSNPYMGYFGSKTFAERAAWKFMETEKPNFTLTCFDPPTVLGPVIDGDLKALNTSHWFLLDILTGKHKDTAVPENISFYFVDVRDLAAAHVKAINTLGAFNDRFMLVKGTYTNREVVEIIRANFPEYRDQLPAAEAAGGDLPKDGLFEIDHSKRRGVFGDELISLQTCVVDMVNCFKQLGL